MKNEIKIASRVSSIYRDVLGFHRLLFESHEEKFRFRRVEG